MDVRELRGQEIAKRARIVKQGNAWLVPSQSGEVSSYRVTLESNEIRCTCPDFELRAKPCKHIYAAAIFVQRQTVTETTNDQGDKITTTVTETAAAVRVSYPQNWRAYNAAQTAEKELFCHLWRDLCATVPQPEQKKGRPRVPVADALFVAGYKVYSGMSGRRFATDVREAHAAGLIGKPYHFNTVLNAIDDAEVTPALHELVAASAAPLRSVESTFAVDSTGFGITQYYRHFTAKWGGAEIESHDWLKLHALVGTNTNVIAAASITDRNANDSPQFAPLLLKGTESFEIQNVVADKAYGSRKNVALVAEIGANPWIALRSNVQAASTYTVMNQRQRQDSMAWRWLWHTYNLHRDAFLARYHARSNAESTFSAMKRVFGDTLRSKNRAAQENELLLKVIAFNITCLIHSIFELGVEVPGLSACTQNAVAAHKRAG